MDIDAIFKAWMLRFSAWLLGLFISPEDESSNLNTPEQLSQFVREDPWAKQRLRNLFDGDAEKLNVYRVCRDIREGRLTMDDSARHELAERLKTLGFKDEQITAILMPLISTSRQVPARFDPAFWSRLQAH